MGQLGSGERWRRDVPGRVATRHARAQYHEKQRENRNRTFSYCEGGDLNPYSFRNRNLNPARLPIPPPSREGRSTIEAARV